MVAFVLSACATAPIATPPKSASPEATASPTPEPTPSPTPDLQAIGASYLALVDPLSAVTCAFNAVLSDPAAPLKQLTQGAADYAIGLRAFADGLRAIDWPADIEGDARDLIAADAALEAFAQAAAAAPTSTAFNDAFADIDEANKVAGAAANLLRGDLGLPSITGNPC